MVWQRPTLVAVRLPATGLRSPLAWGPAAMSDNGGVMTANVSPHETNEPLVHLEQRVRRLEDAVAQLQDTRPLEERLVERVTARARLSAARDGGKADMHKPEPPAAPQTVPTAIPVVSAPRTSPTTWLGLIYD